MATDLESVQCFETSVAATPIAPPTPTPYTTTTTATLSPFYFPAPALSGSGAQTSEQPAGGSDPQHGSGPKPPSHFMPGPRCTNVIQ